MNARKNVWFLIAASLILLGCILLIAVLMSVQWDFTALSTVKYTRNTYRINQSFDSISMKTDNADIAFVYSDDGKCKVECYEEENTNHSVYVDDGTLTIERTDERAVYDFIGYIGLNFESPKITVYLPKTEYQIIMIQESTGDIEIPNDFNFNNIDITLSTGDVLIRASASDRTKIKTSTGNILVENINAGCVDLSVSTGEVTAVGVTCEKDITIGVSTGVVKLNDVACRNLTSSGSTGDISLNHVIAAEKFSIERSTGDVKLEQSDAAEIFIKTDTGDIMGSILSNKVFIAESDTGHVDVPKTVNGGRCEIVTDTGDIRITVD